MRLKLGPSLLLVCVVALGACARGGPAVGTEYGAEVSVEPDPPVVGPAVATLLLANAEGDAAPLTGASVELEATMSHAGMVPVFARAPEIEPGRYEAPFEFTMAGDWILIWHITLADGSQVEHQAEVRGVTNE